VRINREHIVGLTCIAIAIAVLCITPTFPKGQEGANLTGPAFFPNVLAIAFIILGILQIIDGSKPQKQPKETKPDDEVARTQTRKARMKPAIEFIALLIAFILLFEPLGFIVSTLLFLFLLMLLLGLKWWKSLLYSGVYTIVIYLLFAKLFTVGLPAGILGFLGI